MTSARLTRVVVIASTVVAALVEAFSRRSYTPADLLDRRWPASCCCSRRGHRLRSLGLPMLMAALYLMPAIFLATLGNEGYGLDVIWILPLLGLMLSDRGAWQLVAAGALAVAARDVVSARRRSRGRSSFCAKPTSRCGSCRSQRVSNTSIGHRAVARSDRTSPIFALGHNLGILFIDALFRWYATEPIVFDVTSFARCWPRPASPRSWPSIRALSI